MNPREIIVVAIERRIWTTLDDSTEAGQSQAPEHAYDRGMVAELGEERAVMTVLSREGSSTPNKTLDDYVKTSADGRSLESPLEATPAQQG